MPFWNRQKKNTRQAPPTDADPGKKSKKKIRYTPPVALEVKLLAMEALESGLSPHDVAEIVGVTETTLAAWRRLYQESGVSGPDRVP